LQEVDDAQRTSQKISFDYHGPEDFLKLRRTFEAMGKIKTRLKEELKIVQNLSLEALVDRLKPQNELIKIITDAIDEDALVRDKEISVKTELAIDDIDSEIEGVAKPFNNENQSVELDNEKKKTSTAKKKRSIIKNDSKNSTDTKFEEVQAFIKADNWIIKKKYIYIYILIILLLFFFFFYAG